MPSFLWKLIVIRSSKKFSFSWKRKWKFSFFRRDNLDWGLLQLDTIRDRSIVDDIYFLSLTHFGLHTLHHLLPTVDHYYLHLCRGAFEKTCQEFGIKNDVLTPWEAIKGQFKQLARLKAYKNWRWGIIFLINSINFSINEISKSGAAIYVNRI